MIALLTPSLVVAINRAVRDALTAHSNTKQPQTEPHLVAAVFRNPKVIAAIIDGLRAQGYRARVRSVFIHGKPMVEFECAGVKQPPCELGDAFVVYRERLRQGQARSQAVLIQAKMWKGANRTHVDASRIQWALYQHWPPFEVLTSSLRLSLPPGDYGRMVGIRAAKPRAETPRVSHRIPTLPGCAVPSRKPRIAVPRSLGWLIADILRFGSGERVDGPWALLTAYLIRAVGTSLVGPTFQPPGRRGVLVFAELPLDPVEDSDGFPAQVLGEVTVPDEIDDLLDRLIAAAGDAPPDGSDTQTLDGDFGFTFVVIDSDASS
jgi:hypothetical protein